MKQFFKVFKFEYSNIAKNKGLVVLTSIVLAVLTLVLFFPRFKGSVNIDLQGDKEKPNVTIIDHTEDSNIFEYIKSSLTDFTVTQKSGNIDTAKEIALNENTPVILIELPLSYKYIVNNKGMYDDLPFIINELLLSKYKNEFLFSHGINENDLIKFNETEIKSESIIVGQDQTKGFMATYVLILLLYMAVMMYGQFVSQSVAIEKSSKAMELLITSANPKSLIFGKVLGAGLAGLTQLSVILIWSFICFNLNKSQWKGNEIIAGIFDISPSLIFYAILFFIMGFLFYSFINGALASLATKMEDIGTLTMPTVFLLAISFIATLSCLGAGKVDNTVMKVLSFLPFSSPMAMFARIAMNSVSLLEIIISIIILFISILLVGYLAVAIYRVGILMYGKPPRFNELLRAIRNNKE